jgi:hypothetical protein
LGYPRSGLERSDFVLWHFSDLIGRADDVRSPAKAEMVFGGSGLQATSKGEELISN